MALEVIRSLGHGGGFLNDRLPKILQELQNYTISGPITGVAANNALVDPNGPDIQDTIQKIIYQTNAAGAPQDITSTTAIIDVRPAGTVTVAAGIADGDQIIVNGKTYTAKSFTPSTSNRGSLLPGQFSTGKQGDGSTVLTAGMIAALGLTLPPANGIGVTAPLTSAQCVTLAGGTAQCIAALSLANAINGNDAATLTASVSALSSAITLIWADAENTAGNAITLNDGSAGGHMTKSGATLSGGLWGNANGTATCAAVQAADTVTIGGVVFTGVASTTSPPNYAGGQFPVFVAGDITVGADCNAQRRLMEAGLSMGQAQAILTNADATRANNATAYLLAYAINATTGAKVTATVAAAVVTITADDDGAAGAAVTLVSSTGTRLAVTGSGTLTAPSRGFKSSTATNGPGTVMAYWWKKSRVVGQQ